MHRGQPIRPPCRRINGCGPQGDDLEFSIEPGEEIDTLSLKILDGEAQIMAAGEALKILEQKWQPMASDAETDPAEETYAGLLTVETLQHTEISWEKIEGVQFPGWRSLSILMGILRIHIDATEFGVSA